MNKTWKPLDIDSVRATARNRIHRVGIELEGGWVTVPGGTRVTHDGSVHLTGAEAPGILTQVGELPSPPMDMTTWKPWIKQFYPSHVNDSCGMHVHMSFKTALTYQRLMTSAFPATVLVYMGKWAKATGLAKGHPIWPRLAGKSMYCQHLFHADEQVTKVEKDHNRERDGHRYTIMNYAYGRLGTVECRLLPMMADSDLAIAAIDELLAITNGFLLASKGREAKLSTEVEVDESIVHEESRVYV